MMFAVVERFDNRVTVIMVLPDRTKAINLADFLNEDNYFEHEITVESYPEYQTHQELWKAIERSI